MTDLHLIEDIYPASYLQMGMLLESNLDNSGTYHDVFSYSVKAKFNEQKFLSVWEQLIHKHELLRASFVLNDENGWNVIVYKNAEIEYRIYKNLDTKKLVIDERLEGFNYSKPGLFRLIINDLGNSFNLIFSFHHVIADGWSIANLINEFIQAYKNNKSILLDKNLRYGEYVRNELRAIKDQANIAFWKEYLSDFNVTKGNWKFDKARSENSLFTHSFAIVPEQVRLIHKTAKELKISVDCIFLLAYLKTLSYFTNNSDVIIGLVVNNRLEKEGGDKLFGLFLNTIPFRFQIKNKTNSLSEFIRVFDNKINLQKYKQLPYGYIKSLFGQELYDVAFNFTHFDFLNVSVAYGEANIYERTNIPFILDVSQHKDSDFTIRITAHENYISQNFLEYFAKYYKECISNVLINSSNALSLTKEDYKQIINKFNLTERDYKTDKCLHTLFEEQVKKSPEAIALVYEDHQVSYKELNERANKLAHYLRGKGVSSETLVAISVDRSLDMVVGLLAILKAGGVYVPLDPSYPSERLQFMLEDTNAPILLTQSHLKETFDKYDKQVIILDEDWRKIAKESVSNPIIMTTSANLAYVIYTSGSTGRPKGVENVHGGICNRLLWTLEAYPICPKDSMLYIATVGFDISIWEMIFPLMAGGKLVIAKKEESKDPEYIFNMIVKWGISVIHFVPSLLDVFLDQIPSRHNIHIKQVVCGGEGISVRLKERFYNGTQISDSKNKILR